MTDKVFPSIFVSHGAPTLVIEDIPANHFLRDLGADIMKTYGKPEAILTVSAHWETFLPTISTAEKPETIYDFGGFPRELYEMIYPANGAPQLAIEAGRLLLQKEIQFNLSPTRGFDHGAWAPLKLMFPDAGIPTTQLSVMPRETPEAHFKLGQALAELRGKGVLILATGGAVHNLRTFGRTIETPAWAQEFDEWIFNKLTGGDLDSLLNYQQFAPHAQLAHPTPEHFLPLFVAMGAGDFAEKPAHRLHQSWSHASFSMASYRFGV